MVGKVKSKNFTTMEKKFLITILQKYGHIVENKKSNAATLALKEEAWVAISNEFNTSSVIAEKRSIVQLKKLWTNVKQSQREALTRERQSVLATGSGPKVPEVEIDPDVTAVVPNLMQVAPTDFTSNMSSTEIAEAQEAAQCEGTERVVEEIEVLPVTWEAGITLAQPSTSQEEPKIIVIPAHKRKRKNSSSPPKHHPSESQAAEERLKVQRIQQLIEQDQALYQIQVQKMQLEIRAAAANTRRAELLLEEQEEKK